MTDQERKAMEMALEALFDVQQDLIAKSSEFSAYEYEIQALRQALAQGEQELLLCLPVMPDDKLRQFENQGWRYAQELESYIKRLHAQQAQPEQSILICSNCGANRSIENYKGERDWCPFAGQALAQNPPDIADRAYFAGKQAGIAETLAQPKQEPYMWARKNYGRGRWTRHAPPDDPENWIPLYTAPPSKPWVSLTDEEINDVAEESEFGYTNLARAIEAALRSKNNE